jgi:ribosomal protein S18 acetylase RimI-like enzyme
MPPENAIVIRTYDLPDFASLCQLVAEFFSFHRSLAGRGPMPPEEAATLIPTDMLRPECTILVAEMKTEGTIVGFCRIELHEGAYFLRELIVTEKYRLQGIGSLLLRAAEKTIQDAGESNLYLSLLPRNTVALRFFVRNGYNTINTIELRKPLAEERVQRTSILLLGLKFQY